MVEVAGVEPENSYVNSKPCTVWCPYRCPSVTMGLLTGNGVGLGVKSSDSTELY